MGRAITIDPITRLEGHGKITIVLDDGGEVERAFFQVPELRGFEAFCVGRPAEDMPQITSRICGVCPSAHHMAAAKALDALYQADPPPAAKIIRELFYNMFTFEDHLIHFYYLGGPDFIVGPDAPAKDRNILGVIAKVGLDTAKKVIEIRKRCRELMAEIGGKVIHPVLGLPGGVAKNVTRDMQVRLKEFAKEAVAFAEFTLETFDTIVLKNKAYMDLILSDIYHDATNYMGLVDAENKVNFYNGKIRVVDVNGKQLELFSADAYTDILSEHVEDFTYIKFPYLKKFGWKGFAGGGESGIVRVAPLGRLNASNGMGTRLAQEEYQKMYATLGGRPCHNTLAWHWARLVEVMYAAERIAELSAAEALTDPHIRNMALKTPQKGIGVVEAPRGTLIHHYETDANGLIVKANLLVATVFNSAAICMSIEKAARKLIKNGQVDDGLLNKIEMAFRAYDPCFSCATHNLPGKMPLEVVLRNKSGDIVKTIMR